MHAVRACLDTGHPATSSAKAESPILRGAQLRLQARASACGNFCMLAFFLLVLHDPRDLDSVVRLCLHTWCVDHKGDPDFGLFIWSSLWLTWENYDILNTLRQRRSSPDLAPLISSWGTLSILPRHAETSYLNSRGPWLAGTPGDLAPVSAPGTADGRCGVPGPARWINNAGP